MPDTMLLLQMLVLLLVIGGVAGVLAGLLGVGGGIVLVPAFFYAFQTLGYDGPQLMQICLATSLATIIVTSVRSVMSHNKKGAVDWHILKTWMPGIVVGAIVGVMVAASLAYLLLRQQDAVGLALFDEKVRDLVGARSTGSHLKTLLEVVEKPGLKEKTDLGVILHQFADRINRKGLIVIISDMLDDIEHIERGLKHLRYCNHEVILFHLLDKDERTFPFQNMTMFEGLEGMEDVLANPRLLKEAYLGELEKFLSRLRRVCRNNRFDYVALDTSDHLDVALSTYLAKRTGSLRR